MTICINNHACSWQYIRQFLLQVESASVNLCVNRTRWFTEHEQLHVKQHTKFVWSGMWNSIAIHDHWGYTCESSCETPCEVYLKMCVNLSNMWNSFAIQWGSTRESLFETPCEVYVKICVKGMTSLHTLFTYISLCTFSHACEICVWN